MVVHNYNICVAQMAPFEDVFDILVNSVVV